MEEPFSFFELFKIFIGCLPINWDSSLLYKSSLGAKSVPICTVSTAWLYHFRLFIRLFIHLYKKKLKSLGSYSAGALIVFIANAERRAQWVSAEATVLVLYFENLEREKKKNCDTYVMEGNPQPPSPCIDGHITFNLIKTFSTGVKYQTLRVSEFAYLTSSDNLRGLLSRWQVSESWVPEPYYKCDPYFTNLDKQRSFL